MQSTYPKEEGRKYFSFFTIPWLVLKFENLIFTYIPDSFSQTEENFYFQTHMYIKKLRLLKCNKCSNIWGKNNFFKNKIILHSPFDIFSFFHSRIGKEKARQS